MSSIQTAEATNTKPDLRSLIKSYGLLCVQKEQLIGTVPPETIARLDTALTQLEETLAEPRVSIPFSLSSKKLQQSRVIQPSTNDIWTYSDLTDIGITLPDLPPHTIRKPGCEAAVAQAAALAPNDLWSSENFIRQLQSIEETTCIENETMVNGWVDAFFRRVIAMLPKDKHMAWHMENQLLPKIEDRTRIAEVDYDGSGFMHYTVMLSRSCTDVIHLMAYDDEKLKDEFPDNVILVTAGYSQWIETCVTQAVYKMYDFAVTMEKKIVRGAVTRGDHWIFLILTMNDDFEGGTYRQSHTMVVECKRNYPHSRRVINDDFNPHYITAILMDWIQNSFSDIDDDDLFLKKVRWGTRSTQ